MSEDIKPTTELTDDAILELAEKHYIASDACTRTDILAFTKALLSRKSESEAVAWQMRFVMFSDLPPKPWQDIPKEKHKSVQREISEGRTGVEIRELFTSPQPSDEKYKALLHEIFDSAKEDDSDFAFSLFMKLREALGQ